MTRIMLTSDQSQVFASATDVVTFCDASGNVIVRIQPRTAPKKRRHRISKTAIAVDQPRVPYSNLLYHSRFQHEAKTDEPFHGRQPD